ncbi:MAG: hypothetical protein V1720_16385 [bacterium]
MKYISVLIIVLLSSLSTNAQDAFFYKGRDYGSESFYNPIFVILNGGLDILQVNNERDVMKIPFYAGAKNVFKNLVDPITPINNYGWWNFIQDQVLPVSFNKNNAQYWPNYTLHLIGGGMTYAATREWFEYHKYDSPELWTLLTMTAYHLVNEVAENGSYQGDNVDPIADIYLFDLGGIILFSSDGVKKFFAETLNLADWSLQPSMSVRNGELHNNGQYFSIKWQLPYFDKWHFFYFFGTNGVGGLSYKYDDGTALSVGIGAAASKLITLDVDTNKKTLDLVWNLGVFYDKNNSLLASLLLTKRTDYMINLNIYPGFLKFGEFSPGIWTAYSHGGKFIFGITTTWFPVGLAYNTK